MDTLLQILLFGGLMFVMMRFGCGSHMMGHGSKDKKGSHSGGCCGGGKGKNDQASTGEKHSKWVQPEEDRDPVCGKMVSKAVAKTSVHDGLAYYFCSTDCRDAFESPPSKYVDQEEETVSLRLNTRLAESDGHG